MNQAGTVRPFAGVAIGRVARARARKRLAVGLVGLGEGEGTGFVHELAHEAERVGQEIRYGSRGQGLGQAHVAGEVGVGAVGEDLRQAGGEVEGVVCGHTHIYLRGYQPPDRGSILANFGGPALFNIY